MKHTDRKHVLRALSDISDETDSTIRALAQRGWREKAGTVALLAGATGLMQSLERRLISDDAIHAAAIQLEKRQRRLIRLVTARMRELQHDIELLTELEKKLQTSAGILQAPGTGLKAGYRATRQNSRYSHRPQKFAHAHNSTHA